MRYKIGETHFKNLNRKIHFFLKIVYATAVDLVFTFRLYFSPHFYFVSILLKKLNTKCVYMKINGYYPHFIHCYCTINESFVTSSLELEGVFIIYKKSFLSNFPFSRFNFLFFFQLFQIHTHTHITKQKKLHGSIEMPRVKIGHGW